MTAVIETDRISRNYGVVRAVEAIDLRIQRAEIYALLGLNGAGKTTMIRMLLGMVRPSEGHVALFGERLRTGGRGPWQRVGHLVETACAYPELTVRENLEIAGRLHGMSDGAAVARILEQLGLAAQAQRRASVLSLGNLQRLALARALLHRPDLLILDEPANALDPAGVVEVRELVRSLAREHGVTVFMSSHVLAEVDRLATRIGIIDRGRLIEELDAHTLERRRTPRLVVDGKNRDALRAALEHAGFRVTTSADNGRLVLDEARAIEAPDLVASVLVAAGTPPTHLAVEREDLEQYFLRLTSAGSALSAS